MKIKNTYYWLIWGGILALLLGLLLQLNILPLIESLNISILSILSALLFEGIIAFGSGLIVAFFSTKIKVSDKIYEMLSKKGKEELIDELLPPEDRLADYKQKQIKYVLNREEEYRTKTVYTVNASIQNNRVVVETTLSYTVHFAKAKEPVMMRFDDASTEANYIKISNPQNSNDSFTFDKSKLSFRKRDAHGDGLIYEWSCKIPKKFKKYESLNIEKKYTAFGQDHWITYGVIFQHLTEGLDFTLTLNSDLKVKEHTIFENVNVYSKTQNNADFKLKTSEWLSTYGGFSLLISK